VGHVQISSIWRGHCGLQKLLRTRRQAGPVPPQLSPLRACADADTGALPNHSLGVSVCCVVKQNHAGSELSWNQSVPGPTAAPRGGCSGGPQMAPPWVWPQNRAFARASSPRPRGPVPPGAASVFRPPPPGCPGGVRTGPPLSVH